MSIIRQPVVYHHDSIRKMHIELRKLPPAIINRIADFTCITLKSTKILFRRSGLLSKLQLLPFQSSLQLDLIAPQLRSNLLHFDEIPTSHPIKQCPELPN